jgi:hypothetical protein
VGARGLAAAASAGADLRDCLGPEDAPRLWACFAPGPVPLTVGGSTRVWNEAIGWPQGAPAALAGCGPTIVPWLLDRGGESPGATGEHLAAQARARLAGREPDALRMLLEVAGARGELTPRARVARFALRHPVTPGPHTVRVCVAALASEPPGTRREALDGLARLARDAAPARRAVEGHLGDPDPIVRVIALRTLRAIAPDAYPPPVARD